MIKEWRKEGDKYVWTGNWLKPSPYGADWLYEGDSPTVHLLVDPSSEYDTAPQNAPTTHEVATGSDKTT